ncbi:hypothetical protein H0H81_004597 [Sphagnurus paluster]|uniref:ABM domain-containing protein n=1 Tax=Sphagnurus paluster TaxID=117069 RepID=A0A9P7K5A0_9AGAR|nr:hypothetical protein H0H81_004597 [Sphagnurus paluster]
MAPSALEIIRIKLDVQPPATWYNDLTSNALKERKTDVVARSYGFTGKSTEEFVWVNIYKNAFDYVSIDSPTRAEFALCIRNYSSKAPRTAVIKVDKLPSDEALYAILTEVSDLPFKKNLTIQEINALLKPKFDLEDQVRGVLGAAWSFEINDDHRVVIFSGWKSVEDYEDAITNHKEIFREIVKNIREALEDTYEVYATQLKRVA